MVSSGKSISFCGVSYGWRRRIDASSVTSSFVLRLRMHEISTVKGVFLIFSHFFLVTSGVCAVSMFLDKRVNISSKWYVSLRIVPEDMLLVSIGFLFINMHGY